MVYLLVILISVAFLLVVFYSRNKTEKEIEGKEPIEELHIEDERLEDKGETCIDLQPVVPAVNDEGKKSQTDKLQQIISEIESVEDLMDPIAETTEDDKVITIDDIENIKIKARFYEMQLQYRRAYMCYYKILQFYENSGKQKETDVIRNKLESLLKILKVRNEEMNFIHSVFKTESASVPEATFYVKERQSIDSPDHLAIPYDKAFADNKRIKLDKQNREVEKFKQTDKSNWQKDVKEEIRNLVYRAKRNDDIAVFEEAAEMALKANYPKGWIYSYYNICFNFLMDLYRKQGDILKEYNFITRVLENLRPYMREGIDVFESRYRELNRIISSGMPQEHKTKSELKELYKKAARYERERSFKQALEKYSMIACAYLDARDVRFMEIIEKKCDIYRLLGYQNHELSEMSRALYLAEEFKHSLIEDYRTHFGKRKKTIKKIDTLIN